MVGGSTGAEVAGSTGTEVGRATGERVVPMGEGVVAGVGSVGAAVDGEGVVPTVLDGRHWVLWAHGWRGGAEGLLVWGCYELRKQFKVCST